MGMGEKMLAEKIAARVNAKGEAMVLSVSVSRDWGFLRAELAAFGVTMGPAEGGYDAGVTYHRFTPAKRALVTVNGVTKLVPCGADGKVRMNHAQIRKIWGLADNAKVVDGDPLLPHEADWIAAQHTKKLFALGPARAAYHYGWGAAARIAPWRTALMKEAWAQHPDAA